MKNKTKFLVIMCLLTKICASNQTDFVVTYFVYKNVPNFIGFTCDDNILLSLKLNELGIRVAFPKLNTTTYLDYLLNSHYWKIGIFLDVHCYENERIIWLFSEASKKRWYGELHSWLVYSSSLEFIKSVLDDKAFGLSTDFVIALPTNSSSGGYELYDNYNAWKEGGSQLNVTLLGYWGDTGELKMILQQSKFSRRANLQGINMKAAFFGSKYRPKNTSIEDYLQDYTTQSKDGLSKFGYNILVHFSEMYNITLQFSEVQKWREGDTVGPLSRALQQNEIQITGSPIVMTIERLNLIKFVYPTWPFRTCFIFRNPQPQEIKIGEVLRPFATESWYMTSVFLFIFMSAFSALFRFEKKELADLPSSNAFVIVIAALCQQGTSFDMSAVSSRIVFIHLMIFSVLIYNYYSASIVSARLNEPIVKMNDSLNELARSGLKLTSEPMIYFEFLMKRLPPWEHDEFYANHWLKIPEDERFMYPEKAIPLVQQGSYAYHAHPDASYPIIDRTFSFREICELNEVHIQHPVFATLAVTYNSSFSEMSKIGFAKMSEVGIRHRQLNRWSSRKPRCRKDVMNVSSTDLYEFAPHLIVLFIGMVSASILLFFEVMFANYKKKYKMSKRRNDFCYDFLT